MAKLLFALEGKTDSNDDIEFEGIDVGGHVFEDSLEVQEDATAIEAIAEGIDLAIVATERLEEIQYFSAMSTVHLGGVTPLNSSILNVAIEAICANIGVKPEKVGLTQMYSAENFSSEGSRKQYSTIAVEGLGDFIKNLWEKIKNAFKSLWKKITDFWDKHISTLGRIRKSLVSMKGAISNNKYEMQGDGRIEKTPSSLLTTFASDKGDLTTKVISTYVKTHFEASNHFGKALNQVIKSQDILGVELKKRLETKTKNDAESKKQEESEKTKTDSTENKPEEKSTSTESLTDIYYAEENALTDVLKKLGNKVGEGAKRIKKAFTPKDKTTPETPQDTKAKPEEEQPKKEEEVKETPKEKPEEKPEAPSEAPLDLKEDTSAFNGDKLLFGSKESPLAGGVYYIYTFNEPEDDGSSSIDIEKETIDATDSDAGVLVPSKSDLSNLTDGTLKLIDKTIKSKEVLSNYNKEFEKTMTSLSTLINKSSSGDVDKEEDAHLRKVLNSIQSLSKNILTFSTTLANLDVQLAKGVLYYVGLCLKQYKK